MSTRRPPDHLRAAGRRFWRHVTADFDVAPWQTELLRVGCEALDRVEEARVLIVEAGGPVYTDRFGQPRPHPAVKIEEQARLQFTRIARELALEPEPALEARPPRIRSVQ